MTHSVIAGGGAVEVLRRRFAGVGFGELWPVDVATIPAESPESSAGDRFAHRLKTES